MRTVELYPHHNGSSMENVAVAQSRLEELACRWMDLMREGRLEEAWLVSDETLRAQGGLSCRSWPRHRQFIWDGTPLEGKRVLVRCYHGLGDTIQHARFLRMLKPMAREVIVWAQPLLIPLLQRVRGIDTLLPLHEGEPDVPYDVDIEITEIAYALRVTLAGLSREVPYIHVDGAPRPRTTLLSVGLVWRSGDWDPRRSVPVELLAPLGSVPGVRWQVLQRGPGAEEWCHAFADTPSIDGVLDEARRLRSLDLLVSVDTCSAHLAGALGVPVWTLLHAHPDWRWMQGRSDSPWYPTMRLFRQRRAGEWQPVVVAVADSLGDECSRGASLRSARRTLSV